MQPSYFDIELAVDFVSAGRGFGNEAYIDIESGRVYLIGDLMEDENIPTDIDDADKYLSIPSKSELGLGKRLAIQFTSCNLPSELDNVYSIFSRKGAYSRFKALLESVEKLDSWHEFEEMKTREVILEWCSDHGIDINPTT